MKPLSRAARIEIRAESIRFTLDRLGAEGTKHEYLGWIEFFERVLTDGSSGLHGVYGAPSDSVVALRVIGSTT